MNIAVIDISGKVYKYDEALCASIADAMVATDRFIFACPYSCINKNAKRLKLCSLVPARFRSSTRLWKRLLKMLEGIVNYLIILCYIKREDIHILHLQWLPFLEFCLFEKYWLRIVRRVHPNIQIILTVHNIYPHNSSASAQKAYKKRLQQIIPLLDSWVVHTHNATERVHNEYGIPLEKIHTIHHGVFVPQIVIPKRQRTDSKIQFLLFGQQSRYKGTDLLIHAIAKLPTTIQDKITVRIIGSTDSSLFNAHIEQAETLGIEWKNKYIEEADLMQAIQDSDVLLYPYRAITQSGALLLGLYFQKPMIVSNLPAFAETLGESYPDTLIVEPDNLDSLVNAIKQYVENPTDKQFIQTLAPTIIENNSWSKAAHKTIQLYKSLYQNDGTH